MVSAPTRQELTNQLRYMASAYHEAMEQTHGHDGTRGVTFETCRAETCQENAALLARDADGYDAEASAV